MPHRARLTRCIRSTSLRGVGNSIRANRLGGAVPVRTRCGCLAGESPQCIHSRLGSLAGTCEPGSRGQLRLDSRPCTQRRVRVSSTSPPTSFWHLRRPSGRIAPLQTRYTRRAIRIGCCVRFGSASAPPTQVLHCWRSNSAGVRFPRSSRGVDNQCVAFCSSPNTATAWAITGTRRTTMPGDVTTQFYRGITQSRTQVQP
jgi:hypothetical protein